MNLLAPSEIKNLLLKHNARPSKGLGQNFLIDKNVLEKIILAAGIKEGDEILEVGPGIGALTQELAKRAKRVVAVEKDQTMLEILKETLKEFKNVEIINGDILKFIENCKLKIENYRVVANIPYYITSPLIRALLESENRPDEIILMIQKEVAQRICSKPPKMSLLSVSVQFYAKPEIVSYVSKNCFWPAPKVDSAIIKIVPKKDSENPISAEKFFKVARAGFSQPRKQLQNNLSTSLKISKEKAENFLKKAGLNPSQRAETLSVDDWKKLCTCIDFD